MACPAWNRLLFLLCAGVLASPIAAQQPGEKPPEKCWIEGTVVRVGTNEPLRKARISLERAESRGQPAAAVVSDASGKFILKEVDPGRYRLNVERNGYVRQQYGQRGPGQPGAILTLEPGRRLRDLIFKMVPSAAIAGRVFDEDGEPVPWVQVQAMRYRYFEGRRELTPSSSSGQTNDRGEYRIFGLAPGRYIVSATLSPWMRTSMSVPMSDAGGQGGGEGAYVPTYYPGTTDSTRAGTVEVKAGDEIAQVDFTLQPVLATRIRGRVFNSITGKPATGSQIVLQSRESDVRYFMPRSSSQVEGPQGEFEVRGVVPGSYTLAAFWFDGEKSYVARQPLDVSPAGVEGITLVIAPGVEIQGLVRIEAGGDTSIGDLRVALVPRDSTPYFGGGAGGRVKPDGTFALTNLPEGEYRVSIWGLPDDFYVKAARLGSDDALDAGVTVAHGKTFGSMEMVISGTGARVEGSVLNEDNLPVSGARVVVVPDGKRRENPSWYKSGITDQYGRFVLRGIAPGSYRLFAWEEIEFGIWQDPDFLQTVEKLGLPLELAESATRTVELKSIPAAAPPK